MEYQNNTGSENIPSPEKEIPAWKSMYVYHQSPDIFVQRLGLDQNMRTEVGQLLTNEASGKERGQETKVNFSKLTVSDLFPEEIKEGKVWFSYTAICQKAAERGLEPLSLENAFNLYLELKDLYGEKIEKKLYVPTKVPPKSGDIPTVLNFARYSHGLECEFNLGGEKFVLTGSAEIVFESK